MEMVNVKSTVDRKCTSSTSIIPSVSNMLNLFGIESASTDLSQINIPVTIVQSQSTSNDSMVTAIGIVADDLNFSDK